MKVYADHAATTPMRERAKAAMIECLEEYGNPSSIHTAGRLAAMKLESARKEVAELLNCRPAEIYFTSGGTEADSVLGPRSAPPFLASAEQERVQCHAGPAIEGTHAPGASKLVGGQGQHINPHFLNVHRNVAHRLHRVRMKNHKAAAALFDCSGNFRNRLECPDCGTSWWTGSWRSPAPISMGA